MTIRKQPRRTTVAAALPLLFAMPVALSADEGADKVRAHLVGYEEVPTLSIDGPIVIWLCSNLGNGPPGTPLCPPSPATVTGTAHPADVTAGADLLGIHAGDLGRMIDAIRAGAAYANVHTTARPGGEVRGQIHSHDDD